MEARQTKSNLLINIINVNCQSVNAKREKADLAIELKNPDIITGTESWLSDDIITDGEIFPPNYHIFRHNRP